MKHLQLIVMSFTIYSSMHGMHQQLAIIKPKSSYSFDAEKPLQRNGHDYLNLMHLENIKYENKKKAANIKYATATDLKSQKEVTEYCNYILTPAIYSDTPDNLYKKIHRFDNTDSIATLDPKAAQLIAAFDLETHEGKALYLSAMASGIRSIVTLSSECPTRDMTLLSTLSKLGSSASALEYVERIKEFLEKPNIKGLDAIHRWHLDAKTLQTCGWINTIIELQKQKFQCPHTVSLSNGQKNIVRKLPMEVIKQLGFDNAVFAIAKHDSTKSLVSSVFSNIYNHLLNHLSAPIAEGYALAVIDIARLLLFKIPISPKSYSHINTLSTTVALNGLIAPLLPVSFIEPCVISNFFIVEHLLNYMQKGPKNYSLTYIACAHMTGAIAYNLYKEYLEKKYTGICTIHGHNWGNKIKKMLKTKNQISIKQDLPLENNRYQLMISEKPIAEE